MAWKLKYRCRQCGYEAEVYEGRGLFRQEITAMTCPDCQTIQNIVVGGIIADVAPSYRSEVGRLCLQCGSDNIKLWDKHTCPKCQGEMEPRNIIEKYEAYCIYIHNGSLVIMLMPS